MAGEGFGRDHTHGPGCRCDGVVIAGTTEGRRVIDALNRQGYVLAATVATALGEDVLEGVYGRASTMIFQGKRDFDGFCRLFGELSPGFVVDASHPFAVAVTETVKNACQSLGIPYVRFVRPEDAPENPCAPDGNAGDGSRLYRVDDAAQAAKLLSRLPGNILLTTGANTAHVYVNGIEDFNERGYIRVLDTEASVAACQSAGICSDHILACRPPFTVEDNLAAIKKYNIRILVTKDSGAAGGVPQKLESIRQAGITGVILRRPTEDPAENAASLEELFVWLKGLPGAGKRES